MARKLEQFKQIMTEVYGAYTDKDWQPKPFSHSESRYLWTDAYGVCNYLTLFKETGEAQYCTQAKNLISAVHDTLGKTRDGGAARLGNSPPEQPLLGGLRIGKPDEEGPGMSGDGQYFHYLTKWMFALNRMSLAVKEPRYNQWAIEMARAVHWKFCAPDGNRMYWKMSIDLSRPLTTAEGGLDTFDGLTIYMLLQETAKSFVPDFDGLGTREKSQWEQENLKPEIDHMQELVATRISRYTAHDTLDAGEALWLAHFFPEEDYACQLKRRAGQAVEQLWLAGEFIGPPTVRLGFREFGTTIGVQMHPDLWKTWEGRVEKLHELWLEHLQARDNDITPVMYCTSLIPGAVRKSFL
ncbi:hypothetical protein BV898_08596 [Hypsibius exemplaris]|uniref:Uncharacterized protein n=1 Tax=Hypsibius exemplaris TaxID=2072580 RepID=A0A1W0WQC4_HYPEX|nr:hypothetical protein BV898_08596 [Hypsibius exemplaris]